MAAKQIGGISVGIVANIQKFEKSMTLAQKLLKNFVGGIKNAIFSLKGLAVALAVGAFTKVTAAMFGTIGELDDLSTKTGVATEKLAAFQLAASEVGVSNELLERSLTILSAKGMTLEGWSDQTAELTSHQAQLNATMEMFGKKGGAMIGFLRISRGELHEMQLSMESVGMAIDNKMVAAVDRAGEAFARFKLAIKGIFASMAVELAPYITILSNRAFDALSTGGTGKSIGQTVAFFIIETIKRIGDGIQKIVGNIMEMVVDIRAFFHDFRVHAPAWMGVGFHSAADKTASSDAMQPFRKRMLAFKNQPKFSDWFQGMVDKMPAEEGQEKDSLFDLLKSAGRVASKAGMSADGRTNLKQMGQTLMQGLGAGMFAVPGLLLKGQLAANGFDFDKKKSQAGNLAFAESGSADSYRQQASIRRQNETLKLDKDRNKLLAGIQAAIKGGGLPAAGLG